MKCKFCDSEIKNIIDIIIQEEFNNVYCQRCGEFLGEIIEKEFEPTNDNNCFGIIKMYIKKGY